MYIAVLVLVFVSLAVPLFYVWRLFRLDEATRGGWLIALADIAAVVLFILLIARWDVVGFYTLGFVVLLLLAGLLFSIRRHAGRPWAPAEGPPLWKTHWASLLAAAGFGGVLLWSAGGFLFGPAPHQLAFPLEGGRFVIGQGGPNSLLNRHRDHRAQRYAADILAIGGAGFRATGLMPHNLAAYEIFGARVVSPCAGEVIETRDGLADLPPPQKDPENAAGNHVILLCEGMEVTLAHLSRGSVAVEEGDTVATGDFLGLVGNSGNTTEPHLHIHAVDPASGEGVRLAFDGSVPIRNRLYSRWN